MGIALFEDVRLGESPEMGTARSLAIDDYPGSVPELARSSILPSQGMVEALDRSGEDQSPHSKASGQGRLVSLVFLRKAQGTRRPRENAEILEGLEDRIGPGTYRGQVLGNGRPAFRHREGCPREGG